MPRKRLSTDQYREGLAKNHGQDFVEDFDAIFSGDITLAQIGRRYNLTKMRVTQIFERLYGKKYREAFKSGQIKDKRGEIFKFERKADKNMMIMLPEDMYGDLKAYAKSNGLSMSGIVRDLLSDFLSGNKTPKINDIF